jgi:hypothetical protein
MTGGVEPVAPQPTAAETKVNSFQRITGVLFSPAETFESIASRPDILIPLLILMAISLTANILIAQHVDFGSITRDAIEQSSNASKMTPDQVERGVRFGAAIAKATTYAAPVLQIIVLSIVAGMFLLSFRMFGGEGDYKQAFSILVYGWYPLLVQAIIATVVLMNRKELTAWELSNPIRSNLAFLVDRKVQPFAAALLGSLDIFTIWSVVLFIIGYAAMSKMSRSKSATIVIALWVLYVGIFKMGGAALQAMRMK